MVLQENESNSHCDGGKNRDERQPGDPLIPMIHIIRRDLYILCEEIGWIQGKKHNLFGP